MANATLNGHYNFSRADLPQRVIHVGDTLANEHGGICLIKPTNWDFHVLSHTWSQDIRDLSKDIGQLLILLKRAGSCELHVDTANYNQAFLKENFSGKKAYKDLAELLRLLRKDGVESIWFDALCIDQTDDREKQVEISRMAAYYANSKGCYVLMHGVGQGYSLWRPDSAKEMPRWFERVWTLQEFILPRSLTFIVEGLDDRVVSVVNQLITKSSPSYPSSIGLCSCCIPSDLLVKRPSSISAMCEAQISAADHGGPYSNIRQCSPNNRDVCCCTCRSKVLLRSTSKLDAPLELLHFVDREAFLLVARAALLMDTPGRWIKNWGYEQMLCSMYKLIERRPNPRQIMSRVGERYCSVPEDRVLSILGLLGVQDGGSGSGAEQLRTGQTLDKQIVKAANLCDQDTIIELCATDAAGYYIQGMSWSPNFRDNWDRYSQGWMHTQRAPISLDQSWTSDMQWIRPKVEVLRPVTASGMRLRCRTVEAHIVPNKGHSVANLHVGDSFRRLLKMSKWQHCLHSDDNRDPRPQVVSRVQQKNFKGIYMTDLMPWISVYRGFSTQIYLTVASELIPEDANEQELEVLGEFKVWLVQLGSVDVQESSSESGVELIMVCLGSSDHAAREGGELELHKVGMYFFTDSLKRLETIGDLIFLFLHTLISSFSLYRTNSFSLSLSLSLSHTHTHMKGAHVQSLVYCMVARGEVVLAHYSAFPTASASFAALGAACLRSLRSSSSSAAASNMLSYKCDAHTFHFLMQDHFTYLVVSSDSKGEEIAFVFLQRMKEDFYKRYGDATTDTERFMAQSLERDFGPRLKEHMQYCLDNSQKLKKLTSIKDQVLEVKEIVSENIEKVLDSRDSIKLEVDSTEIIRAHAENFHRQGQKLKKEMRTRQIKLRLLVSFISAIIILILWLIVCKGFEC